MLVPRIILLPTFITLIFAFSHDVTGIEEKAHLASSNKILSMQLSSLKEHSKLLELSNKKMSIIRHDFRHYNQILSQLIMDGDTDAALNFITKCDGAISQTKIEKYSLNPIINAALSIYISRASSENIQFTHDIRLPNEIMIDENDFAILICNLLENAFNASYKQPSNDRRVNIIIKGDNNHLVLSIANRCQETVCLGKDELPTTQEQGHGIGMRSLKAFKEKFKATVFCDQSHGWFKIMISVADKA
jgi:signal transduction histidine kinase